MDKKTRVWLALMKIGSIGCHQIYERSFSFRGYQFPVCARCTGIFLGNLFAIFLWIIKVKISIKLCGLLIVIMACDGFLQFFKIKESNNIRRVVTGFLAGIAYIFALVNIGMYLL